METQELGFAQKSEAAKAIIANALNATVSTRQEHADVGIIVDTIRQMEKALTEEYDNLPVVVEALRIQKLKGALSRDLEDARKAAKAKMLTYEDFLEAERVAEELKAQITSRTLTEEAMIIAALEAEQSGDKATAEAIINEPVTPAVIVVPKETLKAAGHTRRRIYRVKITNYAAIPPEYMCADMSKIEATARAWKREGEIIPGVQCWSEVV